MQTSDHPGTPDAAASIMNRDRRSLSKKLTRWITDYRWLLIALTWLITVILGYIGYSKYFAAAGSPQALWDTLYNTLRLFTLNFQYVPGSLNTELQIARFGAPAISLYTAIQAVADIYQDQFRLFKTRFLRGHTIICGLGQKGESLARVYSRHGEKIVVVESDSSNKSIPNCKDRGNTVLMGNAANPDTLRRAGISRASRVICTTGNDGINAEIAVYARELARSINGRALSCLVHIVDLQLWSILREYEMRLGKLDTMRMNFFNIYESGARVLLYQYPPYTTRSVQESEPSIIVIGIGRMGESLVVNIIKKWVQGIHATTTRPRITMIDREAKVKKESICLRYPHLEKVCDLIPLDIDFNSPEFEKGDFLFAPDGKCDTDIIYICPGGEVIAVASALKLQKRLHPSVIPIIVRTDSDEGLATIINSMHNQKKNPVNVFAFPLLRNTCVPEMVWGGCTYEILARAIHEDYVLNATKRGETPETNPSTVSWEELPESLRESNRNQAEHISTKLESIGYDFTITTDWDLPIVQFSPGEIEEMAILEHGRFVAERLRQGWKQGNAKDEQKKISPDLIPWDELSDVDKDKDRNTVKAIPQFLAKAGYQIYRIKMRN